MRKQTLVLLALAMVMLLAVSVFAVAQRARIAPRAYPLNCVDITKTFDLYGVICTTEPCAKEGKCLGIMDSLTSLSICGLVFTEPNTEYLVYDEAGNLVGSSVGGLVNPVCISKSTEFGRVRYTLSIKMKNPGRVQSCLKSITLCLAATDTNYVGSDYEQIHYPEDLSPENNPELFEYDPVRDQVVQKVILPDQSNVDDGQNVVLCQLCP